MALVEDISLDILLVDLWYHDYGYDAVKHKTTLRRIGSLCCFDDRSRGIRLVVSKCKLRGGHAPYASTQTAFPHSTGIQRKTSDLISEDRTGSAGSQRSSEALPTSPSTRS